MVIQTEVTIRFHHMDRAGMIFHGAYAEFFQDAFEDLMEAIGFVEKDLEPELGIRVPVVHHEMRFPRPPDGDKLTIAVTVQDTGDTSATFHLEARDQQGTVTAEATVTRVCIDADGHPTSIPGPLREAWQAHKAEPAR